MSAETETTPRPPFRPAGDGTVYEAGTSRSCETEVLKPDTELEHESGLKVTVKELSCDHVRFHGEKFKDPRHPEIWLIAILCSIGTPCLVKASAYPEKIYTIEPTRETITIDPGNAPIIIDRLAGVLRRSGRIFIYKGVLIKLSPHGEISSLRKNGIKTLIERLVTLEKYDHRKNEYVKCDLPTDFAERICEDPMEWCFPVIHHVTLGPLLREDGSLIKIPGYDKKTGFFLLAKHWAEWFHIPENPTREQTKEAAKKLWQPFGHYPFEAVSATVQLCALLTVVQRPTLEAAPGFAWNAGQAGSGKTKAAQATMMLTGNTPVERAWTSSAAESKRAIHSSLKDSHEAIFYDNVEEPLSSSSLCIALTGKHLSSREIGASKDTKVSTNVFFAFTGNNLTVTGDLSRRVLVSTIDHGVENPERLSFPFDPVELVEKDWAAYRVAALTLLCGFYAAGAPKRGEGSIGSFEQWDAMIRQCVVWLRDEGLAPIELTDPAKAFCVSTDTDPAKAELATFISAWFDCFADHPIKAAEVIATAEAANSGENDSPESGALNEALKDIFGEDPSDIKTLTLGNWLRKNKHRWINGLSFVPEGTTGNSARWKLEKKGTESSK